VYEESHTGICFRSVNMRSDPIAPSVSIARVPVRAHFGACAEGMRLEHGRYWPTILSMTFIRFSPLST
jgi:hypothetical protein